MDRQKIVADGYDAVAAAYARLEHPDRPWPRDRWLDAMLARVAPGGSVLDLGCGAGFPVAARIAEARTVVGVDISPKQVGLARKRVPRGSFVCADMLDVEFGEAVFDGVVSLYAFDHVPRGAHATLLARIRRWLRPGGTFLLSVENDDRPGGVGRWLDVPMYFSHFDADRTRELVAAAGFAIEEWAIENQYEDELEIPYLFVIASKD